MLAWNRSILVAACLIFGLWLTLPGWAQLMSLQELAVKLADGELETPAPAFVVDASDNCASIDDDTMRFYINALTVKLARTGAFALVNRKEIEAALKEQQNHSPDAPKMPDASRTYIITSRIHTVYCIDSHQGAYGGHGGIRSEVWVSATVELPKLPPLLVVNTSEQSMPPFAVQEFKRTQPLSREAKDALIRQALTNAASQVVKKIAEYRLPCATVLTGCTMGNELILNGGSGIGMRKGMVLMTLRCGELTGRMRVTHVNPTDSYAQVLEDSKGIAPGDMAIPFWSSEWFSDPSTPRSSSRHTNRALLIFLAAGALLVLAGSR